MATNDECRQQFLQHFIHFHARVQRLDFHSPYGCSKGAADQYVIDYARTYGIPAKFGYHARYVIKSMTWGYVGIIKPNGLQLTQVAASIIQTGLSVLFFKLPITLGIATIRAEVFLFSI